MEVSIIIVSYNTVDLLRDCLASVYRETNQVNLEVFVVDNASSDGSAQMVQREFPEVRLIANSENLGFARANNQAMELCSGRYVVLLNPDTLVLDKAIDKVKEFVDQNPNVGLSCCRLLNSDGTVQISSGMHNVRVYKLLGVTGRFLRVMARKISWLKPADPVAMMYRKTQEIKWAIGAFMFVRKDVIDDVGKFDERFFLYGEDNDWCIRMRKNGWKLWYFAGAELIHAGAQSSSKVPSSQISDWYMDSQHYLLSKHSGRLRLIYWYLSGLIDSLVRRSIFGLLVALQGNANDTSNTTQKYRHFSHKSQRYLTLSKRLFSLKV